MTAPPQLDGVSHRDVRANGLRFHVAEAGAGPPMVLLHGWPQHWWMWREVVPSLAQRHRLIMPDLRGLGWSDSPEGGPWDKETLADDVLAILDALELDRVRLVGHDWGAWVSLLLSLRTGDRFERILALSVPPPWDTSRDPRRLAASSYMPVIASGGFGAEKVARAVLGPAGPGLDADAMEIYMERIRRPEGRRASVGYYRTMLMREMPALMRGRYRGRPPQAPVRVVGGTRDPVCRYSNKLEKIPGGHFLPEERPEAVLGIIQDFSG